MIATAAWGAADRFDLPALRAVAEPAPIADADALLVDRLRRFWWATDPPAQAHPLPTCSYLPALQWMVARHEVGGPGELVLAAKGGHNAEQHNHNDVAAVIVAVGRTQVVVDPGAPQYTATTFGPRRYELPVCGSIGHAVPIAAGRQQVPGRSAAAIVLEQTNDDASSRLELDLTAAYPAEAGLAALVRRIALNRTPDADVTIEDRFAFRDGGAEFVSVLPTFGAVTIEPGAAVIQDGEAALRVAWEGNLRAEVQTLAGVRLKDGVADLHLLRIMPREPVQEGVIALRLTPATPGS